jgi:uncharacterized protein (DUF58 family)
MQTILLGSRPTRRSGMVFVAAAATAYGILTTHNNLLYLLFAVLSAAIVIGWIGPSILSRRLRVERSLPSTAHEGTEIGLRVRVINPGDLFQTPAVRVEDRETEEGGAGRPALVGALAPNSRAEFTLPVTFRRRGMRRLGDVSLSTAYPLGLFRREWTQPAGTEILVYPRVVGVRDRLLEGTAVNLARVSSIPDTEREVHALREYQEGDDPRRVNWKATARRDELVVGEYHRIERRPKVALYLDISSGSWDAREDAIRMTASLAVFYHGRKRLIELVTARDVITFGRSERKVKAMLELLALLEPEDEVPLTRRSRTDASCLTVLVHSGRAPRGVGRCDLVIGPRDYRRFAPALGRGRRNAG